MRCLVWRRWKKPSPPPAALAINTWERDRLTALRTRVVEGVKQSLDALPADQRKAALAKLEQLGSGADLQMYKVKSLVDDKQFAEARKALADMAAKAPKDNADLKGEIGATGWLIDLADPAAKPADAGKAMTDAAAAVNKISPALRNELCAAAEALALGPTTFACWTRRSSWLRKRTNWIRAIRNLPRDWPRLLAAQLVQRAAQPAAPKGRRIAAAGATVRTSRRSEARQRHDRCVARRMPAGPGFARSAADARSGPACPAGGCVHAVRASRGFCGRCRSPTGRRSPSC